MVKRGLIQYPSLLFFKKKEGKKYKEEKE